jgi:acetylglutamate kinase
MSLLTVPIPPSVFSEEGGVLSKLTVIKIGGATLGCHDTVITDAVNLQKQGEALLIVHGGAKVVSEWLKRQGTSTRFVYGDRVTDQGALETVTAVLGGLVNKSIVAAINSSGGQAVGITGIDGALLQGRIRDKEMGYVAHIVKVNTALLEALLRAGFIPVVAPLSMHSFDKLDDAPSMLNVNGDTVAGEIAAATKAEKLIFLTDVAGIKDEAGRLITELAAGRAEILIASGTVSGGMIPKIRACLRALAHGSTARIIDGRKPHALLREIKEGGVGTTIK